LFTIDSLMPVSSATTFGPSASLSSTIGRFGETSRARSRPSIAGSASIRSRASRSSSSPGNTPPRIAPRSRM
jgi:hypothetical protein